MTEIQVCRNLLSDGSKERTENKGDIPDRQGR